MKLPGVRLETGEATTLLFVDAGVHVLGSRVDRSRQYRWAGGAVFVALAIAALGTVAGHAVSRSLGMWLSTIAIVVAVIAGLFAAAVWVYGLREEHKRGIGYAPPAMRVEDVAWARSRKHGAEITVVLGMTDGSRREFAAAGPRGAQLAEQFGILLGVTEAGVQPPQNSVSRPASS